MAKVKINNRPKGRPARSLDPMIDWANDIGEWMIRWMESKGRIASGDSINSFEVTAIQNPLYVELKASDSVKYALQGRNKGAFPNINSIKQWIEDKGIRLVDISLDGLAFLIGRKIARSGTSQPRLKIQNIQFAIKQVGKKHVKQLADNLAEDISKSMLDQFRKAAPKGSVKIN